MELSNKEKLSLYIKQLIDRGNKEMEELSFSEKLTTTQIEKIENFQREQNKEIENCKNAIVILYHSKSDSAQSQKLNELLISYSEKVLSFASDFPV